MLAFATTTVSVLSGTTVDDYGDTVDNDTVSASGIPASIVEQSKTVYDKATQTRKTVRSYTGRVAGNAGITEDMRVRDDTTGEVYVVDSTSRPASPVWGPDLRLDLRRIT